jgi:endo-1,4-beta-xylanase
MNIDRHILTERLLRHDPEIEFRIRSGIEAHRKGFGEIFLRDGEGRPVPHASITIRQQRHHFKFGCNAFLLDQFDSATQNREFEDAFSRLFNLAVVPFYWSDIEPERGHPRFARDSQPIYRRPPPDRCLEFCEAHAITPKGHPLLWQAFLPAWLPRDRVGALRALETRVREIAKRYGDRIRIWDIYNEALACCSDNLVAVFGDYVMTAFDVAQRYLPPGAQFIYNETTPNSWGRNNGPYTPLYMLLERIRDRHMLGGIGLQYHLFLDRHLVSDDDYGRIYLNPAHLLNLLDTYACLDLPVSVSEVTIPAFDLVEDGEGFQAEVTERLFRLWFSHPAVEAINWWNLVDGTAASPRENALKGGLTANDMTPKKAYEAIDRLINREWRTSVTMNYRDDAVNQFHGFYGAYELEIETGRGTTVHPIELLPECRRFELTLN